MTKRARENDIGIGPGVPDAPTLAGNTTNNPLRSSLTDDSLVETLKRLSVREMERVRATSSKAVSPAMELRLLKHFVLVHFLEPYMTYTPPVLPFPTPVTETMTFGDALGHFAQTQGKGPIEAWTLASLTALVTQCEDVARLRELYANMVMASATALAVEAAEHVLKNESEETDGDYDYGASRRTDILGSDGTVLYTLMTGELTVTTPGPVPVTFQHYTYCLGRMVALPPLTAYERRMVGRTQKALMRDHTDIDDSVEAIASGLAPIIALLHASHGPWLVVRAKYMKVLDARPDEQIDTIVRSSVHSRFHKTIEQTVKPIPDLLL